MFEYTVFYPEISLINYLPPPVLSVERGWRRPLERDRLVWDFPKTRTRSYRNTESGTGNTPAVPVLLSVTARDRTCYLAA